MRGDTFIQIIRDAGVKAAVIALDDIDMPCHEKWSSPLYDWYSIAAIQYGPSLIFADPFLSVAYLQWIAFCDF